MALTGRAWATGVGHDRLGLVSGLVPLCVRRHGVDGHEIGEHPRSGLGPSGPVWIVSQFGHGCL